MNTWCSVFISLQWMHRWMHCMWWFCTWWNFIIDVMQWHNVVVSFHNLCCVTAALFWVLERILWRCCNILTCSNTIFDFPGRAQFHVKVHSCFAPIVFCHIPCQLLTLCPAAAMQVGSVTELREECWSNEIWWYIYACICVGVRVCVIPNVRQIVWSVALKQKGSGLIYSHGQATFGQGKEGERNHIACWALQCSLLHTSLWEGQGS